jgi:putative copper resistance protein D
MVDLLIAARAVHLASSAIVAGTALFQFAVAEPAFRMALADPQTSIAFRRKLRAIVLLGLVVAVFSGALWLVALAMTIRGQDPAAVLSSGTVWLLLTRTQFGHAWIARSVMAAVVLGTLGLRGWSEAAIRRREGLSAISAAALMGSLAWAGHAAATPGVVGEIHLATDVLHLVAAGAWLGGLLPLWMLFRLALRRLDPSLDLTLQVATHRFSTLGLTAVGTLLATGLVNTWALVGGLPALVGTDYGRLLLAKVVLFVAMVAIAVVNRTRLTPLLPSTATVGQLSRNTLVEIGLGLVIIAVVSVVGVLPPAAHMAAHMQ